MRTLVLTLAWLACCGPSARAGEVTLDPAAAAVAQALTPAIDAAFAFAPGTCAPSSGRPMRPIGFAEDLAEPPERPVLTVTSTADQDPHTARPEPGTLRWALAQARRQGGARIVIDPVLTGARIEVAAPLVIPSSTSLDGGCTGLRLDGDPLITLMVVRDVHDVAIRQLKFERSTYEPESKTSKDAINLAGRFDEVLIEGNRFARCGDGCIDIVHIAEGTLGRVTIARNLFRDHNKVMLYGNNPCLRPDPEPGCGEPAASQLDGLLRPRTRISVIGNIFWGTSQRHPNLGAQVYVHAVNNLIATHHMTYPDDRHSATAGMAALNGGFLLATSNLFLRLEPAGAPMRAIVTLDGDNDAQGRTRGFVRAERNLTLGPMRVEPSQPDSVREPAYRHPVPEIAIEGRDPLAAARCLVAGLRQSSAKSSCES